jgi:putative transposase
MSRPARLSLIAPARPELSVSRQCALVGVSRSSLYYRPVPVVPETLELMRRIDEQYLKTPYYGSRRMAAWLRRQGHAVGRERVRRLMRLMGLEAIYQKPNTSRAAPAHTIYPYLLRGLAIERVSQVWCADITYIPMARGFVYLVAIMDWASRAVLAWRLSTTLDADFCVDALEEALGRFGAPEIFNTDQGSQFTSQAFTGVLLAAGVAISMDGRGRFMDNIFVERLWRSLKYEEVYLHAYDNVAEARAGIAEWISFYNDERPHQALGYRTPAEVFGDRSQQPVDMMDKPTGLPTSPQAQQQQLFDSTGGNGVIPFAAQPHAPRVADGIETGRSLT